KIENQWQPKDILTQDQGVKTLEKGDSSSLAHKENEALLSLESAPTQTGNTTTVGPSQKVATAESIPKDSLVVHGEANRERVHALNIALQDKTTPGRVKFKPVVSIKHIQPRWNFVENTQDIDFNVVGFASSMKMHAAIVDDHHT
ncbi:hypothetical protein ACH5RR_029235, partial [Cinchona calisaya]